MSAVFVRSFVYLTFPALVFLCLVFIFLPAVPPPKSAGQHLLPMCDVYTAGTVFDALCPKRTDVPDNPGELKGCMSDS